MTETLGNNTEVRAKYEGRTFIRSSLDFCTLCFSFPTKMLHLYAPFFPRKCSVSPKKVTKILG